MLNLMTLQQLQEKLSGPFPGISSHLKMAPAHRKTEFVAIEGKDIQPRLSAVLAILFHDDNHLKIVFIRRGEYVGIHSGQIAFPGGRYEESDGDLQFTAIREAEEEIGVKPDSYQIIGQLSDLYVPPSNFLVRAFVAYAHARPEYIRDEREVQEIIEIDLDYFRNPEIIKVKDFPAHNSVNNTAAPYFDVNGVIIWGATAMMLTELIDILNRQS